MFCGVMSGRGRWRGWEVTRARGLPRHPQRQVHGVHPLHRRWRNSVSLRATFIFWFENPYSFVHMKRLCRLLSEIAKYRGIIVPGCLPPRIYYSKFMLVRLAVTFHFSSEVNADFNSPRETIIQLWQRRKLATFLRLELQKCQIVLVNLVGLFWLPWE